MMSRLTLYSYYFAIFGSLIDSSLSQQTTGSPATLDTNYVSDLYGVGDEYAGSGDGNYESTYDDEDGDYDDNDENEVTNDSTAAEWEGFDGFMCSDGNRIGKTKVCNGVRDCYDCLDEQNCTSAASLFFSCYYGDNDKTKPDAFTHENPKCIPLRHFCDGVEDCANGADEIQLGAGFKCAVKDRFRRCVLPDALVCDNVAHCEDRSDMCGDDVMMTGFRNDSYTNDTIAERSTSSPTALFHCLSDQSKLEAKRIISLNQVCDGVFDCDDLSDECLCEIPGSSLTQEVCGGLCKYRLWSDQDEDRNCEECAVGEVYWASDSSTLESNASSAYEKTCWTPQEILSRVQETRAGNLALPHAGSPINFLLEMEGNSRVIECLDLTATHMIRARKCDGRPECLFGEDECGANCETAYDQEWILGSGRTDEDPGDPPFCRLLMKDFGGYGCANGTVNALHNTKNRTTMFFRYSPDVLVCDGIQNCKDGSDEAYCTKGRLCVDTNGTAVGTYDIAQKCDGFSHCSNRADERPEVCATMGSKIQYFPCMEASGNDVYFSPSNYMDGKFDCPNKADECPPFLSKIPQIQALYPDEGMFERAGISSHDRAIDDMPLQIFLVAASFVGLSALVVSFVLVFYNLFVTWRKFTNSGVKNRDIWVRNSATYLREVVVSLSMTVSKAILCSYFAYVKIVRAEDSNYSVVDLKWRASGACGVAGALCLIGTQVPVFTLSSFAVVYCVSKVCRSRHAKAERTKCGDGNGGTGRRGHGVAPGLGEETPLSHKCKLRLILLLGLTGAVMLMIIWGPTTAVAGLLACPSALHDRTQTYAWALSEAAPTPFRGNLIGRELSMRVGSMAVTLCGWRRGNETDALRYFTFPEFSFVMRSAAPSLRMKVLETYGYFGQSGPCLPDFLVHTKGGVAPYDMAVSSNYTHAISLSLIILDVVLILITMALAVRYGEAIYTFRCPIARKVTQRKMKLKTLDSTFSSLVAVEVFTWLLISSLYFVKTAVPGGFTNYVYTVWCVTVLGLNCGVFTPFILLKRKFRILCGQSFVGDDQESVVGASDSKRIMEVKESGCHDDLDESKPLTNGDLTSHAAENSDQSQRSEEEEAAVSLV